VLSVAVFGFAINATYDLLEAVLLFGLVSWAKHAAVAGLLAGVAGVATVILAVRGHRRTTQPFGTLLGLLVTGLAAISLSVFLIAWDLGPF